MKPFCIVYDLCTERLKRSRYKNMNGPVLWETMTDFLERNPSPIKCKDILKDGVALFNHMYNKANTEEMKAVCKDYIKLFEKEILL